MINNWYKPRNFAIPDNLLTGELKGLRLSAPPPEDALFWKMWEKNRETAKKVLETDYFKGILNNKLDPNAYGSLMVQDAYYCFEGQDAYAVAATHGFDEKCEIFMNKKVESYKSYNEYYHQTWHIREAYGVVPGKDIKDYAAYESHVAAHEISPYMMCVMLPCEYLWPWVANELKKIADPSGLYYFWIEMNAGEPNGAYQMANLLEQYRSQIDEQKAIDVFTRAMEYELKVFTSSTLLNNENYGKE